MLCDSPPELLRSCFEHLKKRVYTYKKRRNMIWCIRGLGYEAELAHEFAKLSDHYDTESVDHIWESYDEAKSEWDWSVIFSWLKEDMLQDAFLSFRDIHFKDFRGPEIALEGDWGLSILFVQQIKDRLKLTHSKGNGYLYNKETRIWDRFYSEFLCNLVSETMRPVMRRIIQQVEERDRVRGSSRADAYYPILRRVLMTYGAIAIGKQSISSLIDKSFMVKLNRSTMLLPIKRGRVINVKTLEIRQREAEDYFSFESPVDYKPSDEYKVAEEFFMGICQGDVEFVDYLRRLLAYFMTGETTDRRFYILVGSGLNGKSTLVKLMELMLGKFYKCLSEASMLSQERAGSCTPEIVPLLHARLGVLQGNRDQVSLNNERLKAYTGGDTLVCRPLYSEEINFTTQTKVVLMTNTLPRFNAYDKAMIDRVVVLPFRAVFQNNPRYKDKLIKHLDEIFTYIIIKGTEFWETRTVDNIPTIIKNESDSYSKANDYIGMFIDECCEVSPDVKGKAKCLYDAYKEWSSKNRMFAYDMTKFSGYLGKITSKARTKNGNVYIGIKLKIEDE